MLVSFYRYTLSRAKLTLVILCLLLIIYCRAQSPAFKVLSLPKKLESLEFNKILQDKTGFMWFGTAQGLFRYDGNSYESFEGRLPDENVTALTQDSLGRVWAGFKNGAICFIEKNEVKQFQPAEGLSTLPISDMLFDREGVFWFSTNGDGIYYFDNNRLYRLDDTDGMPDLFSYDLEEDGLGNIWVGTDGGAAICSKKESEVQITVVNYSNDLPDNIVKKIAKGKSSSMLLATEDEGIFYFDPKTNASTPVIKVKWSLGSISDFLLVNNWIWVATDQGLIIIDVSEKIALVSKQSTDRITTLAQDAEGGIWIGSKTNLKRSKGDQLQFVETANDKDVLAITVGEMGDIWFATTEGLFRRERKNGQLIISQPLKKSIWANKKVISLYTDSENQVWVGFYGDGVIRINTETLSIRNFSSKISNKNVVNISGKSKSVWLATLGGASQIKLDKNFEVINYSQANGLSTDYLYQVFTDSRNRVWFATDRDGIDMLDDAGFHHFKENLNYKVVYGLAEDSLHHIWANVQNEGLYLFDGKNFNLFDSRERIHSSTLNSFTSGSKNHLIVSHRAGIDIFDIKKNEFKHIFNDGTNAPKVPNLNAIAKNQEGSVFIGTNSGLIIYNHYSDQQQNAPRPFIEQFEVNGNFLDKEKIAHLTYDQNTIKIGFTGFWYQNPTDLNFSYRLETFDDEWLNTENLTITYSRLPPGEYIFKLKVSDCNDFSNARETSLHFVIDPPYWNTLWFYLLIAFVLLISVLAITYYRERKLKNSNRELEAKVRIRTNEIQKKSDEVRKQADEIARINQNLESMVRERTAELELKNKSLEEYAFINAHKLRAPVARVLGLINLMTKLEVKENDKIYLEHLQKTSAELDTVVRSMTQTLEQSYFERETTIY